VLAACQLALHLRDLRSYLGGEDIYTRILHPYKDAGGKLYSTSQVLDRPALAAQLGMLERDAAADNLWDNPAEAQALLKELNRLKEGVAAADGFTALLDDARAALDMAEQEARSQLSHPSHQQAWQCMQQHCMHVLCCEVSTVTRCVDQYELTAVGSGRLRMALEVEHMQRMHGFVAESKPEVLGGVIAEEEADMLGRARA
jgi:hypothetical protein